MVLCIYGVISSGKEIVLIIIQAAKGKIEGADLAIELVIYFIAFGKYFFYIFLYLFTFLNTN